MSLQVVRFIFELIAIKHATIFIVDDRYMSKKTKTVVVSAKDHIYCTDHFHEPFPSV
jgi:hypothetical protein